MNNYKKLFEQISPKESDEVLISKVRARKAENMKNAKENKTPKNFFLRKAVAIPAAALLVVGTVTVSVGAAINWDYAKAFKGMFARQYEGNVPVSSTVPEAPFESDSSEESAPAATQKVEYTPEKPIGTFDFEKYGKPLGIVMEGDGVTATLDGMLVYDDVCYIMYTTTATDELLAKTGGEVPGLRIDFGSFAFKIDGKIAGGMGCRAESISQEGNTKTGFVEVNYNSVDLAGKTLNIDFLAETVFGESSTAVLNQHIDIPIDFKPCENIEKALDFKLQTGSFDGTISKVKVSGFKAILYYSGVSNVPEPGIQYEPTFDEPKNDSGEFAEVPDTCIYNLEDTPYSVLHNDIQTFGDAVVTLKDGTTVVAKYDGGRTYGDGSDMSGEIELRYTYPLNPADVASITFGDYTIDF